MSYNSPTLDWHNKIKQQQLKSPAQSGQGTWSSGDKLLFFAAQFSFSVSFFERLCVQTTLLINDQKCGHARKDDPKAPWSHGRASICRKIITFSRTVNQRAIESLDTGWIKPVWLINQLSFVPHLSGTTLWTAIIPRSEPIRLRFQIPNQLIAFCACLRPQ